jgi:phage FluMu gp28-like protein
MGSSVFGEETILAKITRHNQMGDGPSEYPDFLKVELPYWVAENEDALTAIRTARANMPEDAFQQEYECKRTTVLDTMFPQDFLRECFHDRRVLPWQELNNEGNYAAGFDPGGSGHPAALTVLELKDSRWDQVVLERWRGKSLTDQQAYLEKLLTRCQGLTLAIDPGGLGKQMSDYLADTFGARVIAQPFTVASKHDMSVGMRRLMEAGSMRIARDAELTYELNRTRRVTGGKIDQPTMGKRTHYDSYWATAMAASVAAGDAISVYDTQGLSYLDFGDVD